ncbi:vanadium-dependent haloperoxidase [Cecembia calidifontis]|jgi:hypothetical protein|uniref:PAP2 superfamily protein n=1 Tax=Cecembia calidifontis TaxID=1187080 RepID=A0A4Q7P6F9_9BACT|nr:vanadium-dependent haloperoxidase [Cecembia calidifontis]RZS95098.1 PAP2 superfamily protein [Cecembia calidifontis]
MKSNFLKFLRIRDLAIIFLIFSFCIGSCKPKVKEINYTHVEIAKVIDEVTQVMVHDVTNPPLASRFFAYISLAGLEALSPIYKEGDLVLASIKEYKRPVNKNAVENIDFKLAAILSMLYTAKSIQPSGEKLTIYLNDVKKKALIEGVSRKILSSTEAYSITVADHILDYSKTDGYSKISSLPRYEPSNVIGEWYPTPPGYFPAVEPHFNTLRPFFLDSANQFLTEPPVYYEENVESLFFKLAADVYEQSLTDEKMKIAAFWDCNPFALDDNGHLLIGLKKISPGAHWMGIANIACKQANTNFEKSLEINTVLALTLFDSFISCWDEKYRSNRIRPESAIRKLIDPSYRPFLQTPPFPEYPSGHSVISTASAEVLSRYFGNDFIYIDTVEVKYGLESRRFTSFKQAAEEASISRIYGGIHFKDGITSGQALGEKIGLHVINKLGISNNIFNK